MNRAFALVRALAYSSLFVALLLVYLPARLLSPAGIARPAAMGAAQLLGLMLVTAGAAFTLWAVVSFALVGRGTPAPFDPPRRLVISGPYRWVRNPIYLGAGVAMAGASLYYGSWGLLVYDSVFLLATHVLVIGYEEPALGKEFGEEYQAYRARVRRWVPGIPRV